MEIVRYHKQTKYIEKIDLWYRWISDVRWDFLHKYLSLYAKILRCKSSSNLWVGSTQSFERTGVNFINILRAIFSYKSALLSYSLITVWLCNLLAKSILAQKLLVKCWDKIAYRCQFHQHFMNSFLYGSVMCNFCVWNFYICKKAAHKMLLKLTTIGPNSNGRNTRCLLGAHISFISLQWKILFAGYKL